MWNVLEHKSQISKIFSPKTIKSIESVKQDYIVTHVFQGLFLFCCTVNMSPNLSTNHFMGNKRLYQHVIYKVLRVARIASMVYNQFSNM